MFKMIFGQ